MKLFSKKPSKSSNQMQNKQQNLPSDFAQASEQPHQVLPTQTIQQRIKTLRTLCGLSRPRLAAKYHISFSTLRSWEKTEFHISTKSLHLIMTICRNEGILVSEDWLLTGQGAAPALMRQSLLKVHANQSDDTNSTQSCATLNTLQLEIEAFLQNNTKSEIIMLDQAYPEAMLKAGDLVGGMALEKEQLVQGQIYLALVSMDMSMEIDRDIEDTLRHAVQAPAPALQHSLQLSYVQKLDGSKVIITSPNSALTQWHQHCYDITVIHKIYSVCWIRHQNQV